MVMIIIIIIIKISVVMIIIMIIIIMIVIIESIIYRRTISYDKQELEPYLRSFTRGMNVGGFTVITIAVRTL